VASVYEVFYELRREGVGEDVYTLSEAYREVLGSRNIARRVSPERRCRRGLGLYELSHHEKGFLASTAPGFPLYISLPWSTRRIRPLGQNQITTDAMETYRDIAGPPTTISPIPRVPSQILLVSSILRLWGLDEESTVPDRLHWYSAQHRIERSGRSLGGSENSSRAVLIPTISWSLFRD